MCKAPRSERIFAVGSNARLTPRCRSILNRTRGRMGPQTMGDGDRRWSALRLPFSPVTVIWSAEQNSSITSREINFIGGDGRCPLPEQARCDSDANRARDDWNSAEFGVLPPLFMQRNFGGTRSLRYTASRFNWRNGLDCSTYSVTVCPIEFIYQKALLFFYHCVAKTEVKCIMRYKKLNTINTITPGHQKVLDPFLSFSGKMTRIIVTWFNIFAVWR